jgi:hypothetical protein
MNTKPRKGLVKSVTEHNFVTGAAAHEAPKMGNRIRP